MTPSYKQALMSLKIPPVPVCREEEIEEDEQIHAMVTLIGNLLNDAKDKSRQIDSFSELAMEEPENRRPEASHKFFRSVNQLSPISKQPLIKRVTQAPPFLSPLAAKTFNPASFSNQLRLKLGTP